MADQTIAAGFLQSQAAFTDSKGLLSRDGRYFLQALYDRTGGAQGSPGKSAFFDEKGSAGAPGFAAGVDFVPNVTTVLALSQDYGSAANLFITFDGTWQGADQFSLNGVTLTFNSAIPQGTSKVFVKGFLSA